MSDLELLEEFVRELSKEERIILEEMMEAHNGKT